MNDSISQALIKRHAFCWGGAFVIPPIAMVILDLFDRDSPTMTALFSSMLLMVLFGLSHSLLSKGLAEQRIVEDSQ